MRLIQKVSIAALAIACMACQSTPRQAPAPKRVKLDASNIAEAQTAGYKVIDDHGNKLYCRKELTTGSHVRFTTSCLTEAEWRELGERSRQSVQEMGRRPATPRGN